MILIVAPYSPPNRQGSAHLGASRKLETVISILSAIDSTIVLVNSAHNDTTPTSVRVDEVSIGGVTTIEITPPIYSKRTVGKFKYLFDINQVIDAIKLYGSPKLIWFYNGYAFEMLLANKAKKIFNVPMILEFEDWHFSRGRGFNPKPYIDFILWRMSVGFMAGAFVVNEQLGHKLKGHIKQVELLPGIVPQVLADIAQQSLPFARKGMPIHVGFFGGLSVEKGADIVLELAHSLPEGFVVHVTGSGALAKDFETADSELNGKLCYHGRVDDVKLYHLIAQCDVMLNPHASIAEMNNGVFPFKVIEAVASGRLLISTSVPAKGLEDVLVGVHFIEHSVSAFNLAILKSREYFNSHFQLIAQGAEISNARFGENAVLNKISSMTNIQRHQS